MPAFFFFASFLRYFASTSVMKVTKTDVETFFLGEGYGLGVGALGAAISSGKAGGVLR